MITLNGTTGITTPAGTIQGDLTTTGNTVLGNASTDTLNVANGGLVKDSSGNLGLGVTPSGWISGYKALQIGGSLSLASSTGVGYEFINSNAYIGTGDVFKYLNTGYAVSYQQNRSAGGHYWYTAPSGTAGNAISFTQAMTLDSSGNLLVGTTSSPEKLCVVTSGSNNVGRFQVGVNGNGIIMSNASGTTVGSIIINSSATAYNTSSDYRLKENIAPMTGALAKVSALKPCTYTWKSTGEQGEGFIAHELQEVVPDCVTGEKDAVDAEGNPVYQGIDTSFLVATLTAALQELNAKVDSLQAELATLKGQA